MRQQGVVGKNYGQDRSRCTRRLGRSLPTPRYPCPGQTRAGRTGDLGANGEEGSASQSDCEHDEEEVDCGVPCSGTSVGRGMVRT